MEDFKIKGYKIHTTIKLPHLYEKVKTYSYQFLIFNKKGKILNYPFSRIIAHDDKEFILELKKNFKNYLNNDDIRAYPISKFVERITEKSI
ncbi:MAG: hypothetical protein ACFE85_18370 [Candidatus Hodarchaeota archaeon]